MIGDRIKEERQRLELNQTEFAAIAGAAKRTLIDWEKGNSSPTAEQLAALSGAGVDVQYVITGSRRGDGIGAAAIHQAVLDAVDLLSIEKKVDAQQLALAVVKICSRASTTPEPAAQPKQQQVFNDKVGQVVRTKKLNQKGVSFFGKRTKEDDK